MSWWETVQALVTSPLMQRALIAAVLVGVAAPVVGTFLVQRRLALLGDGIGHIALTGVAAGWLAGSLVGLTPADTLALPGAVIAAVLGAVTIEWVRARGKVSSDLAMAILFYGGIAGGVLLIKLAGGTNSNLMSYLFGSISTVATSDLWWTVALAGVVLAVGLGLRNALFAVSHDEEFARASGLPVTALTMILASLAALTVTVAMRVVGLLLVSALMIVPVATAQAVARSFTRTMALASVIGVGVSVLGLSLTYWYDIPPGATIVVLAIGLYILTTLVQTRRRRPDPTIDPHPDHADDVVLASRGEQ